MRRGIVVQARLGSERLQRKVVLDLHGRPLLSHALEALSQVSADCYVVATDAKSACELRPIAERWGFELLVGPDQDVLGRYLLAADRFGLELVVRATGDAPLVSALLAREIVAIHEREDADLSHYLGCPLGTGVEVISEAALAAAGREAAAGDEREHLTQFLYRNAGRFRVLEPDCDADTFYLEANVTVDTPADLKRVRRIYADLHAGHPIEAKPLVAWLRSHPAVAYGAHPHLPVHKTW